MLAVRSRRNCTVRCLDRDSLSRFPLGEVPVTSQPTTDCWMVSVSYSVIIVIEQIRSIVNSEALEEVRSKGGLGSASLANRWEVIRKYFKNLKKMKTFSFFTFSFLQIFDGVTVSGSRRLIKL